MRTPLARTNVNNTAGERSLFWFDVCGGGEGADGGPARAGARAGAAPPRPQVRVKYKINGKGVSGENGTHLRPHRRGRGRTPQSLRARP